MDNIILVGMPGSGKSTIGKILASELGLRYVSTGDIARDIAQRDKNAHNLLSIGRMAPEMSIRRELKKRLDKSGHFILDGFPRNMNQVEWIHERYPKCLIVYIDIDMKTCINRTLARHREDDTYSTLSNRMKYYDEYTKPMIHKLPKFVVDGCMPTHKIIEHIIYRYNMRFKICRNKYWR